MPSAPPTRRVLHFQCSSLTNTPPCAHNAPSSHFALHLQRPALPPCPATNAGNVFPPACCNACSRCSCKALTMQMRCGFKVDDAMQYAMVALWCGDADRQRTKYTMNGAFWRGYDLPFVAPPDFAGPQPTGQSWDYEPGRRSAAPKRNAKGNAVQRLPPRQCGVRQRRCKVVRWTKLRCLGAEPTTGLLSGRCPESCG